MADSGPAQEIQLTKRSRVIILIILSCIYFTTTAAYSLLAPFFPQVAHQKGLQALEIGLIFAIYPFTKGLTSLAIGVILPYVSMIYLLWAGLFLEASGTLLFGFLPGILDKTTFTVFCFVIRGIQGIGAASYQTSAYACVTSVFSSSISSTIGMLETFTSLGFMAGPPIGGLLYKAGGFKLPFIVTAIILILASFIITYAMPRMQYSVTTSPMNLLWRLFLFPSVIIIDFGVALLIGANTFLFPTYALHIKPLQLTIPQVGLMFLAIPAAFGLFSIGAGIVADKFFTRPMIVISCVTMGIAWQFIGPAPYLPVSLTVTQTVLASIGSGISLAVCIIPSYTDALKSTKDRFGQDYDEIVISSVTSGMFSASLAAGQIFGPLIASALPDFDVSYDWTTSIYGFVMMGQAIVVVLLTIAEKTILGKYRKTSLITKEDSYKEDNTSCTDEEETRPILT